MLSRSGTISVRPNHRSKCKAMIIKTTIIRPKKNTPIGVKKLRTRLLPVAILYTISIHLDLKVMIQIPLKVGSHTVAESRPGSKAAGFRDQVDSMGYAIKSFAANP